jgi:hypothetical protein
MHTATTDIFGPALVTPEQYFAGVAATSESSGEKRLMFAILEDAVNSIQRFKLTKNPARRDEYDEAKAWVEARDVDWTFSCENICEVLGIDVHSLRERLISVEEAGTAKTHRKLKPTMMSLESRRRRLALEGSREEVAEQPAARAPIPGVAA